MTTVAKSRSAGAVTNWVVRLAIFGFCGFLLAGRFELPGFEEIDFRYFLVPIVLVLAVSATRGIALGAIAFGGFATMLLGWMELTSTWRPSVVVLPYADQKIADVAFLWLMIVGAIAIGASDERRRAFWWSIVIVGGCVAFIAAYVLITLGGAVAGRLAIPGTGPITLSRVCAVTALAVLALRYYKTAVITTPVLLMLILATGSRGTIVACSATLILVLYYYRSVLGRYAILSLIGAIVSVLILALFAETENGSKIIDLFLSRYDLTINQQYTSGRDIIYDYAVDVFLNNPIMGDGLGGFYYYGQQYAHNLILELACEGGLVALLLFIFATLCSLIKGRTAYRSPDAMLLLTFSFVAAMFSGDMFDNRWVFVALAMIPHVHRQIASRVTLRYPPHPQPMARGPYAHAGPSRRI